MDENALFLSIYAQRLGLGQNFDIFGFPKKLLVPKHVKACFLELGRVTHITGDKVGNTASSVGYKVIFVHHHHFGIWHQPLEPTSSLWSKSNSTDYDNILWHSKFLPASFEN
jgi:hypothetical protein